MEKELRRLIRCVYNYVFPEVFGTNPADEQVAISANVQLLMHPFISDVPVRLPQFLNQLPRLANLLRSDMQAILSCDPAAASEREVVLCYPGLKEMVYYRMAHILHCLEVPILPRFITESAHSITGIDIHPAAQIGDHFCIDHGTGIVIGSTAIIGNNVTLYQGVTLGAKNIPHDAEGQVLDIPRHPILEDDVTVYANTTILGRVRIGAGTVVGGNIWLVHDVPPHSRVVQHPAD